jgi:RNA polymerase sigma-70 factor (ECF subfamily)
VTADVTPVEDELERYRTELTGYCNRMLGSSFEAEDAVQDTLVRAWRGLGRLERRARLRAWLYSIATNVCLDMLSRAARRAATWPPAGDDRDVEALAGVEPSAGGIAAPEADPAEIAARRETVRQAFLAAFQHLPPRQRAALLLCEVLRWRAAEAAELLGTSAASVRSALQRARATLAAADLGTAIPAGSLHAADGGLMARCVEALERDDVEGLAALIREDATTSAGDGWHRGPATLVAGVTHG